MNRSNFVNTAVLAGAMALSATAGILENPFKCPKKVVLIGTMAAESPKTYFYIDDACGLGLQTGKVSAADAAGIEFTTTTVSIANIKEFLKTHALVVGKFNFEASDSTQLSNDLEAYFTSLDGQVSNNILFSSLDVSNEQYNPNLLNVRNQPFVWTNQVGLKINAASQAAGGGNTRFVFTIMVGAAIPYGKLDEFLAMEKIPNCSGRK